MSLGVIEKNETLAQYPHPPCFSFCGEMQRTPKRAQLLDGTRKRAPCAKMVEIRRTAAERDPGRRARPTIFSCVTRFLYEPSLFEFENRSLKFDLRFEIKHSRFFKLVRLVSFNVLRRYFCQVRCMWQGRQ